MQLIAQQSAEVRYNKALKAAGLTTNKYPMPVEREEKYDEEVFEEIKETSPKYSGDEEESTTSGESISTKSSEHKSAASEASSKASRKSKESKESSSSVSNASHRTHTVSTKSAVVVQEEVVREIIAVSNHDEFGEIIENEPKDILPTENDDRNGELDEFPPITGQNNVKDIFDD